MYILCFQDLIETYWDVKVNIGYIPYKGKIDLIETYWDVKIVEFPNNHERL